MLVLATLLSGPWACRGPGREVDLMPAPDAFSEDGYDPFDDDQPIKVLPDIELLYATLRAPAGERDRRRFYLDERGYVLRVGKALVDAGGEGFTWEEARKVSLLPGKSPSWRYAGSRCPLQVQAVLELGILDSKIFAPAEVRQEELRVRAAFADEIDARLSRSDVGDVYVHVHGYKLAFENLVLVAAELWHFLGCEGVMIAFSWPSTPGKWAYYSDAETAVLSAYRLQALLEFLAAETRVERIHVLAYSAGSPTPEGVQRRSARRAAPGARRRGGRWLRTARGSSSHDPRSASALRLIRSAPGPGGGHGAIHDQLTGDRSRLPRRRGECSPASP